MTWMISLASSAIRVPLRAVVRTTRANAAGIPWGTPVKPPETVPRRACPAARSGRHQRDVKSYHETRFHRAPIPTQKQALGGDFQLRCSIARGAGLPGWRDGVLRWVEVAPGGVWRGLVRLSYGACCEEESRALRSRASGAFSAIPKAVIPAKAGSALLWRSRKSRDFSAIHPGRHFRERGNPKPSAPSLQTVIPTNAGIQRLQAFSHERHWIPAFAGMTIW
ncbi:hypothetical protein [Lysobacter gummosus]|uniref:hypothetical protein n=1 Tax=Lysobacter gummosus TaxID=262324 RepID=UPI00363B7549